MSLRHFPSAKGFTLVELLVAMALGLTLLALAASALLLARQGMQLVDQSTQLLDRERLARDVITRLLRQASADAASPQSGIAVFGWDNAVYRKPEHLDFVTVSNIRNGNRPASCGSVRDSSCMNGSDIVLARWRPDTGNSHCGATGSLGHPVHLLSITRAASGEPGLSCAYPGANGWVSVPLLEGVESMQVLYGLQDSTHGHIAHWQHAAQLESPGNPAITRANWQRVRAIRIALVLRGADGVATAGPGVLHPFGAPYAERAPGDAGASLALDRDRRLRRIVEWSVHLPAAGGGR